MKSAGREIAGWVRGGVCAVAGVMLLAAAAEATTIVNDNATVDVDATTDAGVYNWAIGGAGGQQDHLTKDWWWYRIGAGPQLSIDSISAPVVTTPTVDSIQIVYSNSDFDLQLRYSLADSALPGSGQSDLSGSIEIFNHSGSALDFNLYHYTDVDLSAGLDFIDIVDWSFPAFEIVDLTVSQTFGAEEHYATEAGFLNGLYGVGFELGEAAALLAKVQAGGNLDGTNLAGPDDVAYALQYGFVLNDNLSTTLGFDNQISITPIPEPSTAVLAALGVISIFSVRNRRKR